MKNLLNFTILLLAFLLPATATAHDFEIDGFYYNILSNNTVEVTRGYSTYSGDVTIPSTVTYYGTTYSVTTIGDYAFLECSDLTSVTIPHSVTSIGGFAFCYCIGMTSVTIPNSISSIGLDAFEGCSRLASVIVESGNPNYDSRGNCNAIIETASNTFIVGCMNSIIPNSVTSIGMYAFAGCSGLTSVEIPNSVTTIGMCAFAGCSGLTNVEIPNSVTFIGDWAFCECSGLTSVTIGNSVTSIGDGAFCGCSALTSVIVESGNPKYDSRDNCNAIIETESNTLILGCMNSIIPNSVTSIGSRAFYGCTGLTSLTIPNSVTTIGDWGFSGCSGLTSVTCLATTPPTIGKYSTDSAFPRVVTNQATLYVPDESISAYQSAFNWKDFSQIVGITEVPAIDDFDVDGVWYRVLDENTAMVIQRPGEEDYYQGDVMIPEAVTYEDYTFTVVSIDAGAFEDCYDLTSVVLGDAVESIGDNAFQGCTALTSVTIGCGVTAIGAKAFNYCNALQTVTCRGMVPPVMANSNCFTNATYTRATLRVPRTAQADYSTADYWYKFNHIEGFGSAGPGDVDGDGKVGIADVSTIIDYILYGNSDEEFYFESADINGNGRIDIGDVSTLIDMLLNAEN